MTFDFTRLLSAIPTLIALGALTVSFVGLLYTARIYATSHRPYIGVVETKWGFDKPPPTGMYWRLIVKNAGSIPAFLRIREHSAKLTTAAAVFPLPVGEENEPGTYFLMPDAMVELEGQYTEIGQPVPMRDILSGAASLDVTVKLSYDFPSWLWRGTRFYRTEMRFHAVDGTASGFAMVSGEGN